jgi:hypothetical protein
METKAYRSTSPVAIGKPSDVGWTSAVWQKYWSSKVAGAARVTRVRGMGQEMTPLSLGPSWRRTSRLRAAVVPAVMFLSLPRKLF